MDGERASSEKRVESHMRLEEKTKQRLAWLGEHEPETMPPLLMRTILSELYEHEIELQMRNEELRSVQEDLEKARARYLELFELAPVGYVTIRGDGSIQEANLTMAALVGTPRNDLIGKPLAAYILPEDKDEFYSLRERLADAGERQECELRLLHREHAPFWALVDACPARAEAGKYWLTMSDISDRKRKEEEIEELLEEKELILREVHHRMKNNMCSAMNLLRTQALASGDAVVEKALEEASLRIESMIVMYDSLFRSDDVLEVSSEVYFRNLVEGLQGAFHGLAGVDIGLRCDAAVLSADKLFPLGLIANELIVNSVKHAFSRGARGSIILGFYARPGGLFALSIADDGVGMSDSVDFENPAGPGGFGLTLVRALTDQIGGVLEMRKGGETSAGRGTEISVGFRGAGDDRGAPRKQSPRRARGAPGPRESREVPDRDARGESHAY